MKKSVSPGVVIAVIVVVVAAIGIIAYRSLFKDPNASPLSKENMAEFEAAQKRSAIHTVTGQGGDSSQTSGQPQTSAPNQPQGGGMYRHQRP